MKLGKKFIKGTITALLVFSCLAADAASGTVHAAIDSIDTSKRYNDRYLMDDWNSVKFANRCHESKMTWGEVRKKTGLKQVASAFLVGTDDIVAPSWYKDKYKVCDMYAVDPDTEIQGKKINSKYLPQDNGSYLLTIATYHLTSWPFKSSKIYTAPEGMTLGEIKNGSTVYAYAAKDSGSERIGIFTKGTQFDMLPAESGSAWTAIWFSGQKAYVQTKYVKKSSYKVTDISKLELADIVKNEFVFRWNPGKNNADFTVTLSTSKDTGAKANRTKKVALEEKHFKEATFTVDKKYMIDGGSMYITIQANTKNGKKGKTILKKYLKFPGSGKYVFKSYTAGRTEIDFKPNGRPVSLQYSTNKNFKNAKLVEKGKDKYGNYIHIDSVKKLKPDTVYYMRCRGITSYPTANGTKWMTGDWSETAKIKTK